MQFKYKKAVQAFNYIAEKNNGEVYKLKAIKLLWLADRLHLRKYGRTITGDNYVAMPYGPVASKSLDILNNQTSYEPNLEEAIEYGNHFVELSNEIIHSVNASNLRVFSQTDIESLDHVIATWNHIERFDLADISHEFPEWSRFEERFRISTQKRFNMDIYDFFQNVDKYEMFSDSNEELEITKEIFLDSQQLEEALS
ncbi:Panacea domain-containing protein [Arcticibacter eurypsychrophilus]|uniref:Panacea domain-containing protein n=1 Tax=Arcticibacter eurypsychrophilus TaxID=1434752 RepID=UPI00084DFE74|nr:Panacea domain-containing protein [Arcticibacter eurypsychrophilus]